MSYRDEGGSIFSEAMPDHRHHSPQDSSLLQIPVCVTVKEHKIVILCKTKDTPQYERDDCKDLFWGTLFRGACTFLCSTDGIRVWVPDIASYARIREITVRLVSALKGLGLIQC